MTRTEKNRAAVKDLLSATEQFIRSHRWIKRDYNDAHGGYCLQGALMETSRDYAPSTLHNTTKCLLNILKRNYKKAGNPNFPEFLEEYNDMPSTRKKDILLLLRQGIRES